MIENKLKNITVWGVGPHAEKNIIPAIKKNKKLNLYGICTRDKKILKNNVSKYNCKGWSTEKEMLKDKDIEFLIEPYVRFKDEIGEQATMFFLDPSGNALEFKAFQDDNYLFINEN